jgi:hypothetical protein
VSAESQFSCLQAVEYLGALDHPLVRVGAFFQVFPSLVADLTLVSLRRSTYEFAVCLNGLNTDLPNLDFMEQTHYRRDTTTDNYDIWLRSVFSEYFANLWLKTSIVSCFSHGLALYYIPIS